MRVLKLFTQIHLLIPLKNQKHRLKINKKNVLSGIICNSKGEEGQEKNSLNVHEGMEQLNTFWYKIYSENHEGGKRDEEPIHIYNALLLIENYRLLQFSLCFSAFSQFVQQYRFITFKLLFSKCHKIHDLSVIILNMGKKTYISSSCLCP